MGMHAQMHLHQGEDVKFKTYWIAGTEKVDLEIEPQRYIGSELAITMTLDQATELRDALNSIIEARSRA